MSQTTLNVDALREAVRRTPIDIDSDEYAEVLAKAYDEFAICDCGLDMDAHSGGWALLHHDEYRAQSRGETT